MATIRQHFARLTTAQRVVVCLMLPVTLIGSIVLTLWFVRANAKKGENHEPHNL